MQKTITRTPFPYVNAAPAFLPQFICSYVSTNMNVAISSIATDLVEQPCMACRLRLLSLPSPWQR